MMKRLLIAIGAVAVLWAPAALGQSAGQVQQGGQVQPGVQAQPGGQQQARLPAQTVSYDYCVACAGPQSIYLCTVVPHQPDPGARAWGSFCAEQARSAGHSHCTSQTLGQSCQATRALVYRGPRADRQQAEALMSDVPEERSSAAAQIWEQTLANMRDVSRGAEAVSDSVVEGAGNVARGAGQASRRIWDGMVGIGEGVVRGTGCIVTLGARC